MPKPRRMQTPATSDRAIALARLGDDGPHVNRRMTELCTMPIKPEEIRDAAEAYVAHSLYEDAERHIMSGIDRSVKDLIKLAEDQGFTVVLDGTSLKWTNPEGGAVSTPSRVIGRGLQNIKSQLRRIGLDIPRTGKNTPRADETETTTLVVALDPLLQASLDHRAEEPVISAEISEAYAALHVLTEFVAGHQHTDDTAEWQSICEGLEADLAESRANLEQVTKERDALQSKFDTLKSVLS